MESNTNDTTNLKEVFVDKLKKAIEQMSTTIKKANGAFDTTKKASQGSFNVFKSGIPIVNKLGFQFKLSTKEYLEFAKGEMLAAQNGKILDDAFDPSGRAVDAITNMNNATMLLQGELFTGLSPVIEMVTGVLMDLVGIADSVSKVLIENEGAVKTVAGIVGVLTLGIMAYNAYVEVAALVTKGWTIATGLLSIAMSLNPIGIWVAAIAAVVAGIYLLWENCKGFREFIWGLWEAVKKVFENIKTMVTDVVGGIVDVISGIWKALSNPSEALDGISQVRSGIEGVNDSLSHGPMEGAGAAYHKGVKDRDAYEDAEKKKKEEREANNAKQHPANATGFSPTYGEESGSVAMPSATAVQSRPSSINITINKLVERIEIQSTTVKEGVGQLEGMITRTLVAAVNDFQKTAGV